MTPATHNLTIYRDRNFSQTFYFKSQGEAINLTGYSARAEIRPAKDSDTLIAAFTVSISAVAGAVNLTLTGLQTVALEHNVGFWDLVLTDTLGSRETWVEGQVKIQGTVTKIHYYGTADITLSAPVVAAVGSIG